MTDTLLDVKDLVVAFREKTVIDHLNFKIKAGSMTSIVGANGVGKTTLIRVLINQLKPTSGQIQFVPDREAVRIGYVPQFRNIDEEYPLSVASFVRMNQLAHHLPWYTAVEKKQLADVLAQTHLTKLENRPLGSASGGEKQKAYLAQALINQPKLLILDESTASLDVAVKVELMNLVKELNEKNGLTVLFVTHDLSLARKYTQEYLLLTQNGYQMQSIDKLDANLILDD